MNHLLEEYRKEVLRDLKEDASYLKREASSLLGLPVQKIYVIGSVLDSRRFSEDSDVGIICMVSDRGPKGFRPDLTRKVEGKLFSGNAGILDVAVYNGGALPSPNRKLANAEDALYRKFESIQKLLIEHINAIRNTSVTSNEMSRQDPSYFYVYLRDRNPEKAWKSLSRSITVGQFFSVGHDLVRHVLETKAVPKKDKASFQKLAEMFLKMKRLPNKMDRWWDKYSRYQHLLASSKSWPQKQDGSEEKYKVGVFTVHNTVGLSGEDLDKTNKSIEAALKFLNMSSKIPKAKQVLYGDIYIVDRLLQSKTMAWYYDQDDKIYLRPLLKFGRGEVHNLIHELGHRYWGKFLSPMSKKEWFRYHSSFGEGAVGETTAETTEMIEKLEKLKVGDVFPVEITGFVRSGPPKVIEVSPSGWTIENRKGKKARVPKQHMYRYLMKSDAIKQKRQAFPTPYASTDPIEHFCEAFAMAAMGQLNKEQEKRLYEIIKNP